ncbi:MULTISPECIES: ABC transporter substrate-binding protein [Moorena]|uniref:ABC-type dipeptide transport system, periplasmic component n=2 Tax=Moorena TaxID=1155738 RepID=F4Y3X7_9CYAN|nr:MULTISPECIES: ABC transporter substrate-binding protein [Moorena]EGJ28473.1 ABC-type dipeptide transport system, periplasmic component [Moorena producens 3L]NEP65772.1 ABC transporter substrate-binding protein [Moorena sp. SIO3A5]NES87198.1 ABC transporter substrate-binding protein [Moorena sp. SIO2B7]OLT65890.1 peptide ABC transporter substrate-binding protein [Moorena producens 3L]
MTSANSLVLLWYRCLGIFLAVSFAIALPGCSISQFETKAAHVPRIVQSILSDINTFNYALNQSATNIFGLTFQGLIDTDGITGDIIPGLAESWQISDDKLKILFTLREGLKWSDGEPLTTDDVVFTYNDIYLNPEIPTDSRDILRVGKSRALPTVKKIDQRRVEFAVPEPFAPFLRSTGLPVLPAHVLQESVKTKDSEGNPKFLTMWGVDTDPEDIIVNGPYKLKLYRTSQRVVYDRNPYYWKKDEQGNQQPYIERAIWEIVESTDSSFIQFRSGGLDALGVSPEYYSLLKQEEKKGNFTIHIAGPTLSSSFISFNLNTGSRDGEPLVDPIKSRWFNTLEFRQAVAYGIDRQTMLNNLYRGLGAPQYSNLPVQSPYYLSPEKGLPVYDYNPDKAKKLLLTAGFNYNDEGELLDSQGNRVRFTLMTNAGNKLREAMGAQIKQDLSKIGIQVDFTPIAFNTLVDKLGNSLDWECHLLGFSGGGFEPNNSSNVWSVDGGLHSFNQKTFPGQSPIQGRKIADWEQKISDLYIQGAQELDEKNRKKIYQEAQRINLEHLPYIYLINPLSMTAVRNSIEGIEYSALGGAFWNIDELKISE